MAASTLASAATRIRTPAPAIAAGLAFLSLFREPLFTLVEHWWREPDAAHGLLLAPVAVFLAWRRRLVTQSRQQPALGLGMLGFAVTLRYASGLAAELFTMRLSMLIAAAGLVAFAWGWRQIMHWWLPSALLVLAIPMPTVILNSAALPLQLTASRIGATLLEWRGIPLQSSGNIIMLPGYALFVAEACSGLRSLSALIALGVLVSGLWLNRVWTRLALIALAVPVAILLNGVRVFLVGFTVYYVDPRFGQGLMHYTEGWVIFVVAFGIMSLAALCLHRLETLGRRRIP